jgi:hypothetical protein
MVQAAMLGTLAGFGCGLVLVAAGLIRGQASRAFSRLIACTFGGTVLGLLLAFAHLAGAFAWVEGLTRGS